MAKTARLDNKEIEKLLCLVRAKPFLYKVKNDDYHNKMLLKNSWNSIAMKRNKDRKSEGKKKHVDLYNRYTATYLLYGI